MFREKFTPKIHAQNCLRSSPISDIWTKNAFAPVFCWWGDQKNTRVWCTQFLLQRRWWRWPPSEERQKVKWECFQSALFSWEKWSEKLPPQIHHIFTTQTLRAVRAISMSRAKNSLPIVPRQFLSLSYPLWNCPLNCPSNCPLKWFDPWKYANWGQKLSLKLSLECPRGEGNWAARQGPKLSRGNFYPGNQMSHWALWGITPQPERITYINILFSELTNSKKILVILGM